MNGTIIAAIKMAPRKEWEEHWDDQIRQLEQQISGTADIDLPKLKAKVGELMVQKQKFLTAFDK